MPVTIIGLLKVIGIQAGHRLFNRFVNRTIRPKALRGRRGLSPEYQVDSERTSVVNAVSKFKVYTRHRGIQANVQGYGNPGLVACFNAEFAGDMRYKAAGITELKSRVPYDEGVLQGAGFVDGGSITEFGFDRGVAPYAPIVRYKSPIRGRRRVRESVLTYTRSPRYRKLVKEAQISAIIKYARLRGVPLSPDFARFLQAQGRKRLHSSSGAAASGTGYGGGQLFVALAYGSVVVNEAGNYHQPGTWGTESDTSPQNPSGVPALWHGYKFIPGVGVVKDLSRRDYLNVYSYGGAGGSVHVRKDFFPLAGGSAGL